ncbi:VPA1269 family protein [Pseudoalteromonas sp. MQS005]|uniref:gamma-mobile-trio integrase GmtZ n=1 Tax=Pseudoalteromonas sp. MQS005 TaxID=1854052 RepID=UPI0007E524DA|nr:VPA1269 family protein [Pseudoalteromonas sp. MQS005]
MGRKKDFYSYEELMELVHDDNILSLRKYAVWQKDKPKAPSSPWRYYPEFNHKIFFNKTIKWTYSELMEEIHNDKIANLEEYAAWQKDKPKAPSNPWIYYSEYDNEKFFNKEGYWTYSELMEKVHHENIGDLSEYAVWQKDKPKAPSNPRLYYTEYDNEKFFNKEGYWTYYELLKKVHKDNITGVKKYATWKVGKLRAPEKPWVYYDEYESLEFFPKELTVDDFIELMVNKGITKKVEYDETIVHISPNYPKDPVKHFDCKSFAELIKFEYFDLIKTVEYINKHRIKNSSQYIKHAKRHPYLRAHPNKIEGFVGELHYWKPKDFDIFLGDHPEYISWVDTAKELLEKGSNIAKRTKLIEKFLQWLTKNNVPTEPFKFFHVESKFPNLSNFIGTLSKQEQSNNTVNIINEYLHKLLKEYCTDEGENGEIEWLPEFRNPYANYSLDGEVPANKPNETVKPIIPFAYVEKGRKFLCPDEANTFSDLKDAIDIYHADYFEVDESQIDKDDPNCVWRTREISHRKLGRKKQIIYEMWSPVRTIAMLTLFELTIRGQQIMWNDSGEADSHLPYIENNQIVWKENPNPLAGTFKNPQGFIKQYDKDSAGFYCTTNKTKNGEGGYSAPYMPLHLAKWLIQLREWQIKYNPIETPANWSNSFIPKSSYVNKSRIKRRGYEGKQCFLFRDPSAKDKKLRSLPISARVLKNGLPILLYFVQDNRLKLSEYAGEVDGKADVERTLNRYSSDYTPHSLRASLITAYLVDHNLSPTLVAKLVGHASVVMTIYYSKVTAPKMRRAFEKAELEAIANGERSIQDAIFEQKFKDLIPKYVDNESGLLLKSIEDFNGSSVIDKGIGLCPVGGQSCHEGGEKVAEKASYRLPVPTSLVIGKTNCVRCRFFMTSPIHLSSLKSLSDALTLKINDAKERIDTVSEELEDLKDLRDECEMAGERFEKAFELSRLQSVYETAVSELDSAMSDVIATYRLADAAIQLLNSGSNDGNDNNLPIVLNDSILSVDLREVSKFEHLHEVCQNADVYLFSDSKHAVIERSQKIDKLLSDNDINSKFFTLSLEQQQKLGNYMVTDLVNKLGGWEQLDNVAEQRNMLRDYLNLSELKQITTEANKLSNNIRIGAA